MLQLQAGVISLPVAVLPTVFIVAAPFASTCIRCFGRGGVASDSLGDYVLDGALASSSVHSCAEHASERTHQQAQAGDRAPAACCEAGGVEGGRGTEWKRRLLRERKGGWSCCQSLRSKQKQQQQQQQRQVPPPLQEQPPTPRRE